MFSRLTTGLFAETLGTNSFGASLNYTMAEGEDSKSQFDESKGSDVSSVEVSGYGKLQLTKSFSLIPEVRYMRILEVTANDLESVDMDRIAGALTAKFTF